MRHLGGLDMLGATFGGTLALGPGDGRFHLLPFCVGARGRRWKNHCPRTGSISNERHIHLRVLRKSAGG
jgi:hypothetical protein